MSDICTCGKAWMTVGPIPACKAHGKGAADDDMTPSAGHIERLMDWVRGAPRLPEADERSEPEPSF